MTPQTSRTRAGSKRRPFGATAPANRKVTLYIRDPDLWARARRVSGRGGLSDWVQRCLRRCLVPADDLTAQPSVLERARRLQQDMGELVHALQLEQRTRQAPRARSAPRGRGAP